MSQALFQYPQQSAFGRVLPKNKIYEHAKPNGLVRELFVTQVQQITWQYKLAPETINLPSRPEVPEIQIFEIALKKSELDEAVLRCIDQAIPFPIFYQLSFGEHIQVIAAYKRPSEADANHWVLDSYFATPWQLASVERKALPVALDMHGLYEQMLGQLLPLPPRAEEPLKAHVERVVRFRKIQGEYQKLEIRLQKEKQFNRKVELNAQLRALRQDIEKLSA